MTSHDAALAKLGWSPFFSAQLTPEDRLRSRPVRVMAVHRGKIAVTGAEGERLVTPHVARSDAEDDQIAAGDWLLIDPETLQLKRILDRASLFKRQPPGRHRKLQLIAANVDTVFIVASCNADFNLARIERYLVLAREARVHPVIVLTKADLADDPQALAGQARGLQPGIEVEVVNARDPLSVASLAAYCGPGRTVALLGSSGVGKSTLINTLRGSTSIATQAVREGDGKGRHTTTVREMHALAQGGWLLDTPGMRELHVSDAADGIADVFADIVALAQQCRFSNCTHQREPHCAVRADIEAGALEPVRLDRWRKLNAEDAAGSDNPGGRRNRPQAGR